MWQGGRKGGAGFVTPNRIREVHVDGLALLKLVKHCHDCLPNLVAGSLLGLDEAGILEVTHCFPIPSPAADEDPAEASTEENFQMEFMKMLREVRSSLGCTPISL